MLFVDNPLNVKPGDTLLLPGAGCQNRVSYIVQPDPDPYLRGEVYYDHTGRFSWVLQLSEAETEELHALKIFKHPNKMSINYP